MNFIKVTQDNIATEHICCAISNENDVQVSSKKAWLRERFQDGLTFLKADARGKCFIEYLPAERGFEPISAPGYMLIDCFWVAGPLKGNGYGKQLLSRCIADAKSQGKIGLCAISSAKKRPYLSDGAFLKKAGFLLDDEAAPYFTLLYLPFEKSATEPKFLPQAKRPQTRGSGWEIFYTNACPFNAKYAPLLKQFANEQGIPLTLRLISTPEEAQKMPFAHTAYAAFYGGEYITHEVLTDKKLLALHERLAPPAEEK